MSDIGHSSRLWLTYSFLVIFVAVDNQDFFRFSRLHKFNVTRRVVFEFSCLVIEFEIPFHMVFSHLVFTLVMRQPK